MYEQHFGITGLPFRLSPDPSFLYLGEQQAAILSAMRLAFVRERPFLVVIGDMGAGKTTVLHSWIGECEAAGVCVAQIASTQLDGEELARAVAGKFASPASGSAAAQTDAGLRAFLRSLNGRAALLAIDEAQNLDPSALQCLARLAGLAADTKALLRICLAGQPELRARLADPAVAELQVLVQQTCQLGPLAAGQTRAYIEHRLSKVGWSGAPAFDPLAFDEIHRYTQGVPRRINVLTNRLILTQYLHGTAHIDVPAVAHCAQALAAEIADGTIMLDPDAATPEPAPAPQAAETLQAPDVPQPQDVPEAPAADMPQVPEAPEASEEEPDVPELRDVVQPQELRQPAEPPQVSAGRELPAPGGLMVVACGRSDHIKALPLLLALGRQPGLPPAAFVSVARGEGGAHDEDLQAFAGLQQAPIVLDPDAALPDGMLALRFEELIEACKPSAVVVFDGSAAALACAKVAHWQGVALVHVGADAQAAAEFDDPASARAAIVRLADLRFDCQRATWRSAPAQGARSFGVGSLAPDAVQLARQFTQHRPDLTLPGLDAPGRLHGRQGYGVVCLKPVAPVEGLPWAPEVLAILRDVSRDLPLVWPLPPSMPMRIGKRGGLARLLDGWQIDCVDEVGHADFVSLLSKATCVLTDRLDVVEEAAALQVPCLSIGTPHAGIGGPGRWLPGIEVGLSVPKATRAVWDIMFNGARVMAPPASWDGRAAVRIAEHLAAWMQASRPPATTPGLAAAQPPG